MTAISRPRTDEQRTAFFSRSLHALLWVAPTHPRTRRAPEVAVDAVQERFDGDHFFRNGHSRLRALFGAVITMCVDVIYTNILIKQYNSILII